VRNVFCSSTGTVGGTFQHSGIELRCICGEVLPRCPRCSVLNWGRGGVEAMLRVLVTSVCCLALLGPASAAILEDVSGKVLLNSGNGYKGTSTGAFVQAGDRVLNSTGSAVIVYDDGCKVRVKPGTIATVKQNVTCHGAAEIEAVDNIGIDPIIIGGVIVGGAVTGIVLLSKNSSSNSASP
jgi:hypothetical protein